MSILETLKDQLCIEPLLSASHLVVAYSGGVDSHALLHALHSLKQAKHGNFQLSAIHIHHGLSQHADQWQTHCQQVCERLNVRFLTANVSIKVLPRQSLEAQAREARYNKIMELAPTNSHVLLGQHQDDQLETFLLQLKRGAGPKGLSAMNRNWIANCTLQEGKQVGFLRPLLNIKQQDILDYAQQHNLQWCEDESNQNTEFERNFLRHQVLPILQDKWPNFAGSVARSAALCAEQQELLDDVCAQKLQPIKASANSLHLLALKNLSPPWLHQLVRFWLSELGIQSPSKAVLHKLRSEVLEAADDATPILQWQSWQFRRFDQQLFVIPLVPENIGFSQIWQNEKFIELPNEQGRLLFSHINKTFSGDKTQVIFDPNLGPVEIRLGGFKVKFKPASSSHSKPVKQWFKQWKIAPWLRESVVFVIQNDVALALIIEGRWYPAQSMQLNPGKSQIAITLDCP